MRNLSELVLRLEFKLEKFIDIDRLDNFYNFIVKDKVDRLIYMLGEEILDEGFKGKDG